MNLEDDLEAFPDNKIKKIVIQTKKCKQRRTNRIVIY